MSRWALLLALAAALGACDAGFTPRADDGRAFALFGTLDGRTSRQALRVQDLAGTVFDTPDRLPVTVTSTELTSGRTTAWRDSVVTLRDGLRAHLFLADLTVAAGETHRIEATRDADGARSTVTIGLPAPAILDATSPGSSAPTRLRLSGLDGRLASPATHYRVRRQDTSDEALFSTFATPEDSGAGSVFLTSLLDAQMRAQSLLYGAGPGEPVLVEARLEGLVASAEPVPVTSGAGAVGWTVPISLPIPFTSEAVTQVGFVDGR